jgi:hypothetical protein
LKTPTRRIFARSLVVNNQDISVLATTKGQVMNFFVFWLGNAGIEFKERWGERFGFPEK